MKGRAINWLPEELAWVEAHKDWPRETLWKGFCARFGREDVCLGTFKGMCKRKGWMTGRTGHFKPDQIAPNNGFKVWENPKSVATRFRKGQDPHNTRELGAERITRDGYVEISVDQVNPHTGYGRRFVQKHRWLWEQLNGPVPKGMRLKCLDGDKTNTDPANWEPLPMAFAPRLNGIAGRGYDSAPAELKPTIMAITKLEHQARLARKGGE